MLDPEEVLNLLCQLIEHAALHNGTHPDRVTMHNCLDKACAREIGLSSRQGRHS